MVSETDSCGRVPGGLFPQDGLAKVADRLMISEEDASKLFNLAARAHLEPMAKKLVDVFERNVLTKEQYAQKHGTDDGEVCGLQTG